MRTESFNPPTPRIVIVPVVTSTFHRGKLAFTEILELAKGSQKYSLTPMRGLITPLVEPLFGFPCSLADTALDHDTA